MSILQKTTASKSDENKKNLKISRGNQQELLSLLSKNINTRGNQQELLSLLSKNINTRGNQQELLSLLSKNINISISRKKI